LNSPLVAALWPHAPPGGRTPRRVAPPGGVYCTGGKGGRRGERRPAGVPAALACGGDNATAIVVAAVAGPLLPANLAKAIAVEVLRRRYSPPLVVAPLLLWQLLLLLQLLWGVGVCVGVRHHCHPQCHGVNLAVIVAVSAAVAAAVVGGRTRMIASQILLAHVSSQKSCQST
jgi:hypothetical protein